MNHTLHHLRWLLRRYRAALVLYALSWAALMVAVWQVPATLDSWKLLIPATGVLLLTGVFLVLDAVWQDPAPGTDTFWRTRPPRWWSVWTSQFIFVLCGVAGPPALGWVVNGFLMDNTTAQWRGALPDLLMPAGGFLAVAALASFSRRWLGFSLALALALTWSILGPDWFRRLVLEVTNAPHGLSRREVAAGWMVAMPLMLVVLLLCWAAGLRRGRVWSRATVALAAALLVPFLAVKLTPAARDGSRILEIALAGPDDPPQPGDQNAGALVLRGVPEDSVAVLLDSGLGVAQSEEGEGVCYDGGEIGHTPLHWYLAQVRRPDFPGYLPQLGADSLKATGHLLRGLLPGDVRWFKNVGQDAGAPLERPEFRVAYGDWSIAVPQAPLWLKGEARGVLLSVRQLVRVPLSGDAVGSGNGCRVRLERVAYADGVLDVSGDVWLAAGGFGVLSPEGVRDGSFHAEPVLAAVYLPAVQSAVLLTRGLKFGVMRPWQCLAHRLEATLRLEDSMVIVEAEADPLRGAEIIIWAPVVTGTFRTRAAAGSRPALSFSSDHFTGGLSREVWELDQASLSAETLSQRARLVRRILGTRGGYNVDAWLGDKGLKWWSWLDAGHLKELTAAVRDDPYWMNYVWRAKLEEPLRPVALELLRRAEPPLPVSVVAAAAVVATPEDYPRLSRHVQRTLAQTEQDDRPAWPELWRRLRVLPGFDWRRAVRERWIAGLPRNAETDVRHYDYAGRAVTEFAALAGQTEALHVMMTRERAASSAHNTFHHQRVLNDAELAELRALLEPFPSVNLDPRGAPPAYHPHLAWDEDTGRYR